MSGFQKPPKPTLEQQIDQLNKALEKERANREELEQWLRDSLKKVLEKVEIKMIALNDNVMNRLSDMEEKLKHEVDQRKKLTAWLKENIGPNMEKLDQRYEHLDLSPRVVEVAPLSTPAKEEKSKSLKLPKPKPSSLATPGGRKRGLSETPQVDNTPLKKVKFSGEAAFPVPLVSSNKTLASIEAHHFGTKTITQDKELENDVANQTSLGRAHYFLNTRNHASLYYQSSKVMDIVKPFADKGGSIIFAPAGEEETAKSGAFKFGIRASDLLFPVCPDGLNRSQILYLVLNGIKRVLGCPNSVAWPHGCRRGFDPFVLTDDQYKFIPKSALSGKDTKVWKTAFGEDRVARYGEEICGNSPMVHVGDDPTPVQSEKLLKHRAHMREYFDLYYYRLTQLSEEPHRRIFVVFGSALSVLLERLVEANHPADLKNAVVIVLPYTVEPFQLGKSEALLETYSKYASLFYPIATVP